ncbi:Endo-1,4-beta-xylanase/feruloyl esterase [Candidatus Brocadiaceae bacterium]|nr:Endo-1,4-beta-xylanase/feruloyl esterase [Candidatus Brocadiaceae bacterium]
MMRVVLLFLLLCVQVLAQPQFLQFVAKVNAISDNTLKMAAVDSFMTAQQSSGFPAQEDSFAIFIRRSSANTVAVAGDFNNWSSSASVLQKLQGTNFFYFVKAFEYQARLDYKFVENGSNWILDPLNPRTVNGGYGPNSELAMSGYIQPWEIVFNPSIPAGTITNRTVYSPIVSRTYQLRIYTPPGYNPSSEKRYPTVYFQDGAEYVTLASAAVVIDNLIAARLIEPVVAIFVVPNNRNDEYAGNTRNLYRRFMAEELVPSIDSVYKTDAAANRRLVLGDSFGGNISGLISHYHPDIFGNCGLHSGAFWPNNYETYNLLTQAPYNGVRYISVWGTYESLWSNMRSFRDIMKTKGNEFIWSELPEGHSWGLWRANIDIMLQACFPPQPLSVQDKITAKSFALSKNYPNPINPSTSFTVELPERMSGSIMIYNSQGEEVEKLFEGQLNQGITQFRFDGVGLPSGIYFCVLRAGGNSVTQPMVLMK